MRDLFKIDFSACLFGALLLLTLPFRWVLAAAAAAAFHELCHFLTICLLGGHVWSIQVGMAGAVMEMEPISKPKELMCAIAGPLGSLLLVGMCRIFPRLAICAGVQALFNLLPVFPLDGGRAVRCGLDILIPKWSGRIAQWMERGTIAVIIVLSVIGVAVYKMGILPLLAALMLFIKVILRKRPCKASRIGVQ